jgi:hypothetical protein
MPTTQIRDEEEQATRSEDEVPAARLAEDDYEPTIVRGRE